MTTQPSQFGAAPSPTMPLDPVPAEYARNRVLDSQQAADFLGISLPHFRRMYRLGRVPRPIKITDRKLGWPFGVLNDFVAAQTAAQKQAA